MEVQFANQNQEDSLSPIRQRRRWATNALRQAHSQGGMTLLVDGLAGMGKTYLLRELRTAALADGRWQVVAVRADEFEVGEPYSFIDRIVAASQVEDWVFEPGRRSDPIAVARECARKLLGDHKRPGWVFVIDDAQWIDTESYRVLRYLIPRITRRNMLLALGVRSPHEAGSFGAFLCDLVEDSHLDRRLSIEPLTGKAVGALIAERYGVVVATRIAQQIVDETDGNFLEIDSILSAMSSAEIRQLHLGWDRSESVSGIKKHPLLRQVEQLSPPTQAAVELVSLAGHALSSDELNAAASILGERIQLDEAVAAGVLTQSTSDSKISVRHALLADAVTNSLSRERCRQLYEALASVTDGYRSLRHRLMSASDWDDHLSREVETFVAAALRDRKYAHASEVLRASLILATDPRDRMPIIERLVLVHLQAKTGYLVLDVLHELHTFPPSLLHTLMINVLSAHRVGAEISRDAVQEILTSTPRNADERAILAFYAFMVVLLSMRTSDTTAVPALIEHAKELVAAGPASAEELDDRRLGWLVERDTRLLVLDCYQMVQLQQRGRFAEVRALLPKLVERIAEARDSTLKVDAMVAVAGAQIAIGRADLAYATATASVRLLERVGEPWAAGTARVVLGHCMVLHGHFDAAIELMDLAEEVTFSSLDVETRSSWVALRLMVAAVRGDEDADLYVEPARKHREIGWEAYGPDLGVIAECEFARARGDARAVLEATSGDWIEGLQSTQRGFLTYRAHALIDMGMIDAAAELIDQLSRWRGDGWQEYWGTLDWCMARLAEASGAYDEALWHFEAAVQGEGLPLSHGLTLADFGHFLLRQGRHDEGDRMLREAIRTLEGIGAAGYLAKLRAREAGTSLQSSVAPQSPLEKLTPRERQIVEHLVRGRSNSQIAESLVVSAATVRSHISSILRKLGLHSRGEVARLVREADAFNGG